MPTSSYFSAVRCLWPPAAAVLLASSLLTGCATAKAATAIAGPPLAVPEPPPRVLVPAEAEPLASTTIAPETPLASQPSVQPTPPQTRRTSAVRSDTDTRVEAAAPAATAAVTPGTGADTPRELRPVPSGADPALEGRVQGLLTRTANQLRCVDYDRLSNVNKNNHKESTRHSDTAQKALKERNFLVAQSAAEKALQYAESLPATKCSNR
jgi:hypothetical protein